MENEFGERMDHTKTPLFMKAVEVRDLALAIAGSIPDPGTGDGSGRQWVVNKMLEGTMRDMEELAHTIPTKLAGAMGVRLYDLQMEYACLVRRACRQLVTCLSGLEMAGHYVEDHFNLLREAVEEFRPLFAEWVATFKDSDYLWDDWGLFNPPGAMPDLP